MSEQIYEYFQTGMSENWTIYITMMKNLVSHILFLEKGKGVYRIPGSAEKGDYSRRASVLCHIKEVTPPPPPRDCFSVMMHCISLEATTRA